MAENISLIQQDKIILKGMKFHGRHGCLQGELELGQWFVVDLELSLDLSKSGKTDDLNDTLSYALVYEKVKALVEGPPFALIEALATAIIEACFSFEEIEKVKILLKKPQAPLGGILEYAAVELERLRKEYQVWLSLGSNLGDTKANLLGGIAQLIDEGLILEDISGIYESKAVGNVEQPDFLNLAARFKTKLDPLALLKLCQKVEKDFKRQRDIHWGPRTLDIDILLIDDLKINLPRLKVPHREMAKRAFVLGPLAEIDQELLPLLKLEPLTEGITLKIPATDVKMTLGISR